MQLINSSVSIIPQESGINGIYKQIEIAGRTCYKSENNITENSATDFVNKMINNGHTAMLEHGSVYLKVPYKLALTFENNLDYSPYSIVNYGTWDDCEYVRYSTNYRVIKELELDSFMEFAVDPDDKHERRVTVKFICDRGIMAELTRHRVFSFAVESTRYCNYSRDKFNNELTFIKPIWFDEKENVRPEFMSQLANIENTYMNMISVGCKAQEARQILPNALKTEVVMTGFVSDWKHFFDLRCAPNAHPDMQYLANQLKELFKDENYLC